MAGMEGRELRGYTLIREIGRGGMGSVYLAERSDGTYHKQVAIKLIGRGSNNAEITERFQREREILASLDHPNIARLIDGGSTEEGLPYFVMEFVEGRPIHRWCNEHKLNVSQRLELFRSVCGAVQYAHQHLVVHCDLKPSNILVAEDGTVKLLDFGIAKLLKPKPTDSLEATLTLLWAMTPDYASPEQVKGEAISTLTDVYSLGVVLYELLTSRLPHHVLRAAMHEIVRVISEEEPARPSDVVVTPDERSEEEAVSDPLEGDLNRLRKRLRGDLDCIILTALRKEPARRYSSVEALSEDLRRHLEHRPVSAREDGLWYRVNRFVRRNSSGVITGVLIALCFAASLLSLLWEMRIAMEASRRNLSVRTIVAPQLAMWLCFLLAAFAGAAYFTRARLLRLEGALAGGVTFAVVRFLGMRLDFAMGWWRSRFPDTPDPLSLFSEPLLPFGYAVVGALGLLVVWRIARRFGWVGYAVVFVVVGVSFAVRERFWFDRFMQVMNMPFETIPVAVDAAFGTLAFALGYAVMRVIAGPARSDRLARTR
jgi:serine/threonine protein kinase